MHGHILAHFLQPSVQHPAEFKQVPSYPFLCLTVSGGHTQIVKVGSPFDLEYLGQTIDDAAGEAFDKTAKILGLPYPGGPLIDKYAQLGDPKRFKFPIPHSEGLNFSFSGLKTAILYFIRDEKAKDNDFVEKNLNDICASVQKTIVEILMKKINLAIEQTGIKEIAIAGGVSANSGLRNAILELKNKGCNVYIPAFEYCTDNAAMIAIAGYYKFLKGEFAGMDVTPVARY
jgi:N6-L-threonylcarbamoyladenine synthase